MVQYLSAYPEWTPQALTGDTGPHVLLTKSHDWFYEREYRIIAMGEGASSIAKGHKLELSGNYLSVPAGALQAVIAGCEADYTAISKIVTELAPGVKTKRSVRSPSEYRLQIVE
jgi:hypothetical protein